MSLSDIKKTLGETITEARKEVEVVKDNVETIINVQKNASKVAHTGKGILSFIYRLFSFVFNTILGVFNFLFGNMGTLLWILFWIVVAVAAIFLVFILLSILLYSVLFIAMISVEVNTDYGVLSYEYNANTVKTDVKKTESVKLWGDVKKTIEKAMREKSEEYGIVAPIINKVLNMFTDTSITPEFVKQLAFNVYTVYQLQGIGMNYVKDTTQFCHDVNVAYTNHKNNQKTKKEITKRITWYLNKPYGFTQAMGLTGHKADGGNTTLLKVIGELYESENSMKYSSLGMIKEAIDSNQFIDKLGNSFVLQGMYGLPIVSDNGVLKLNFDLESHKDALEDFALNVCGDQQKMGVFLRENYINTNLFALTSEGYKRSMKILQDEKNYSMDLHKIQNATGLELLDPCVSYGTMNKLFDSAEDVYRFMKDWTPWSEDNIKRNTECSAATEYQKKFRKEREIGDLSTPKQYEKEYWTKYYPEYLVKILSTTRELHGQPIKDHAFMNMFIFNNLTFNSPDNIDKFGPELQYLAKDAKLITDVDFVHKLINKLKKIYVLKGYISGKYSVMDIHPTQNIYRSDDLYEYVNIVNPFPLDPTSVSIVPSEINASGIFDRINGSFINLNAKEATEFMANGKQSYVPIDLTEELEKKYKVSFTGHVDDIEKKKRVVVYYALPFKVTDETSFIKQKIDDVNPYYTATSSLNELTPGGNLYLYYGKYYDEIQASLKKFMTRIDGFVKLYDFKVKNATIPEGYQYSKRPYKITTCINKPIEIDQKISVENNNLIAMLLPKPQEGEAYNIKFPNFTYPTTIGTKKYYTVCMEMDNVHLARKFYEKSKKPQCTKEMKEVKENDAFLEAAKNAVIVAKEKKKGNNIDKTEEYKEFLKKQRDSRECYDYEQEKELYNTKYPGYIGDGSEIKKPTKSNGIKVEKKEAKKDDTKTTDTNKDKKDEKKNNKKDEKKIDKDANSATTTVTKDNTIKDEKKDDKFKKTDKPVFDIRDETLNLGSKYMSATFADYGITETAFVKIIIKPYINKTTESKSYKENILSDTFVGNTLDYLSQFNTRTSIIKHPNTKVSSLKGTTSDGKTYESDTFRKENNVNVCVNSVQYALKNAPLESTSIKYDALTGDTSKFKPGDKWSDYLKFGRISGDAKKKWDASVLGYTKLVEPLKQQFQTTWYDMKAHTPINEIYRITQNDIVCENSTMKYKAIYQKDYKDEYNYPKIGEIPSNAYLEQEGKDLQIAPKPTINTDGMSETAAYMKLIRTYHQYMNLYSLKKSINEYFDYLNGFLSDKNEKQYDAYNSIFAEGFNKELYQKTRGDIYFGYYKYPLTKKGFIDAYKLQIDTLNNLVKKVIDTSDKIDFSWFYTKDVEQYKKSLQAAKTYANYDIIASCFTDDMGKMNECIKKYKESIVEVNTIANINKGITPYHLPFITQNFDAGADSKLPGIGKYFQPFHALGDIHNWYHHVHKSSVKEIEVGEKIFTRSEGFNRDFRIMTDYTKASIDFTTENNDIEWSAKVGDEYKIPVIAPLTMNELKVLKGLTDTEICSDKNIKKIISAVGRQRFENADWYKDYQEEQSNGFISKIGSAVGETYDDITKWLSLNATNVWRDIRGFAISESDHERNREQIRKEQEAEENARVEKEKEEQILALKDTCNNIEMLREYVYYVIDYYEKGTAEQSRGEFFFDATTDYAKLSYNLIDFSEKTKENEYITATNKAIEEVNLLKEENLTYTGHAIEELPESKSIRLNPIVTIFKKIPDYGVAGAIADEAGKKGRTKVYEQMGELENVFSSFMIASNLKEGMFSYKKPEEMIDAVHKVYEDKMYDNIRDNIKKHGDGRTQIITTNSNPAKQGKYLEALATFFSKIPLAHERYGDKYDTLLSCEPVVDNSTLGGVFVELQGFGHLKQKTENGTPKLTVQGKELGYVKKICESVRDGLLNKFAIVDSVNEKFANLATNPTPIDEIYNVGYNTIMPDTITVNENTNGEKRTPLKKVEPWNKRKIARNIINVNFGTDAYLLKLLNKYNTTVAGQPSTVTNENPNDRKVITAGFTYLENHPQDIFAKLEQVNSDFDIFARNSMFLYGDALEGGKWKNNGNTTTRQHRGEQFARMYANQYYINEAGKYLQHYGHNYLFTILTTKQTKLYNEFMKESPLKNNQYANEMILRNSKQLRADYINLMKSDRDTRASHITQITDTKEATIPKKEIKKKVITPEKKNDTTLTDKEKKELEEKKKTEELKKKEKEAKKKLEAKEKAKSQQANANSIPNLARKQDKNIDNEVKMWMQNNENTLYRNLVGLYSGFRKSNFGGAKRQTFWRRLLEPGTKATLETYWSGQGMNAYGEAKQRLNKIDTKGYRNSSFLYQSFLRYANTYKKTVSENTLTFEKFMEQAVIPVELPESAKFQAHLVYLDFFSYVYLKSIELGDNIMRDNAYTVLSSAGYLTESDKNGDTTIEDDAQTLFALRKLMEGVLFLSLENGSTINSLDIVNHFTIPNFYDIIGGIKNFPYLYLYVYGNAEEINTRTVFKNTFIYKDGKRLTQSGMYDKNEEEMTTTNNVKVKKEKDVTNKNGDKNDKKDTVPQDTDKPKIQLSEEDKKIDMRTSDTIEQMCESVVSKDENGKRKCENEQRELRKRKGLYFLHKTFFNNKVVSPIERGLIRSKIEGDAWRFANADRKKQAMVTLNTIISQTLNGNEYASTKLLTSSFGWNALANIQHSWANVRDTLGTYGHKAIDGLKYAVAKLSDGNQYVPATSQQYQATLREYTNKILTEYFGLYQSQLYGFNEYIDDFVNENVGDYIQLNYYLYDNFTNNKSFNKFKTNIHIHDVNAEVIAKSYEVTENFAIENIGVLNNLLNRNYIVNNTSKKYNTLDFLEESDKMSILAFNLFSYEANKKRLEAIAAKVKALNSKINSNMDFEPMEYNLFKTAIEGGLKCEVNGEENNSFLAPAQPGDGLLNIAEIDLGKLSLVGDAEVQACKTIKETVLGFSKWGELNTYMRKLINSVKKESVIEGFTITDEGRKNRMGDLIQAVIGFAAKYQGDTNVETGFLWDLFPEICSDVESCSKIFNDMYGPGAYDANTTLRGQCVRGANLFMAYFNENTCRYGANGVDVVNAMVGRRGLRKCKGNGKNVKYVKSNYASPNGIFSKKGPGSAGHVGYVAAVDTEKNMMYTFEMNASKWRYKGRQYGYFAGGCAGGRWDGAGICPPDLGIKGSFLVKKWWRPINPSFDYTAIDPDGSGGDDITDEDKEYKQ